MRNRRSRYSTPPIDFEVEVDGRKSRRIVRVRLKKKKKN